MVNRSAFFLVAFLSVIFSFRAVAQFEPAAVVKSEIRETVNGKTFFVHTVAQGQTLFSIARAYEVTPREIADANPQYPDLIQVVRLGQVIRIPAARAQRNERPSPQAAPAAGRQVANQPITLNTYTVVTTEFIEHRVARRETLFGISRKYEVTQDEILKYNPEARNGLRFKQILRIPVHKSKNVEYFYHTVTSGETRFGLANSYGITLQDLSELNPGLEQQGLIAGQRIRVLAKPGLNVPNGQNATGLTNGNNGNAVNQDGIDPYCHNPELKQRYNVALLVPLFLNEFTAVSSVTAANHVSFTFVPYYQGILIALDSIRQKGVNITLHVFDVARDISVARNVIQKEGFDKMDLIIGPFYPETISLVAGYAQSRGISVVSPLLDNPEQLKGFPNLFQVTPSLEIQVSSLAKYINQAYPDQNIILVHNNQPQASGLISRFKDSISRPGIVNNQAGEILNNAGQGQNPATTHLKEVVFRTDGITGLVNAFDRTRENVVVTLIDGEAFLSNYLRELNQVSSQFNITVFGIPQWDEYQTIDPRHLETLKVHVFLPDFVDYTESNNRDFVYRFREVFKTEPTEYAFLGAKTSYFFFNLLGMYGREFARCMNKINETDQPLGFERLQTNNDGWENTRFYIYRQIDFRKVNVLRNNAAE